MMGLVFPSAWGVLCWKENQGGKDAANLAVHVLVMPFLVWTRRGTDEDLGILIDGETESGVHT